MKTWTTEWEERLKKVFVLAGLPDGHSHQLRDTFSVNLLRVRVPFGTAELVGLVVETECVDVTPSELKSVREVIDQQPVLQSDVFELIRWAAAYYHHPPGDALFSAVPVALRDGRELQPLRRRFWQLGTIDEPLTESLKRAPRQMAALDRLRAAGGIARQEVFTDGREDSNLQLRQCARGLQW